MPVQSPTEKRKRSQKKKTTVAPPKSATTPGADPVSPDSESIERDSSPSPEDLIHPDDTFSIDEVGELFGVPTSGKNPRVFRRGFAADQHGHLAISGRALIARLNSDWAGTYSIDDATIKRCRSFTPSQTKLADAVAEKVAAKKREDEARAAREADEQERQRAAAFRRYALLLQDPETDVAELETAAAEVGLGLDDIAEHLQIVADLRRDIASWVPRDQLTRIWTDAVEFKKQSEQRAAELIDEGKRRLSAARSQRDASNRATTALAFRAEDFPWLISGDTSTGFRLVDADD